MARPTKADWGKIHARAWRDPAFRALLESDPTKAVNAYAKDSGKKFTKLMKVAPKPKGTPPELRHRHRTATVPPACC